jgi:hypothetical protein
MRDNGVVRGYADYGAFDNFDGYFEGYQALVDEVSALLGAPATLEDRDFRLIAFGAHEGDTAAMDPIRTRSILTRRSTAEVRAWFEGFGIARAQGPVRVPADPAAGIHARVCLPVRHRGVVYGYVWLLDDGALDGPGAAGRLAAATAVADRIGGHLAEQARAGAEAGRELLAALTGSGARRRAARAALRGTLGRAAEEEIAVVCVAPWDTAETPDSDVLPGLRSLPGALAVCAVPGEPPAAGGAPAGRLAVLVRARSAGAVADRLVETARGRHGRAGIGEPRTGLVALAEGWREACTAARAARAQPTLGPVARWSAIGPYRMLAALPSRCAEPCVAPLLEPSHAELARTAEVFLDCAGQAARAAAALAVHRQTLYYRLTRVQSLTGLDLANGEDRLLLHMALKAARL